jgi:hypothetical protein
LYAVGPPVLFLAKGKKKRKREKKIGNKTKKIV